MIQRLIQFRHLNEIVGQLPVRQEALQIGRLAIPTHYIDVLIFVCIMICMLVVNFSVRFIGLLAQFIAAVVLISENTSPSIYIPLGIAAFIFGVVEGGVGLWRDW